MTRKIELIKRQIVALETILKKGLSSNPYGIKGKVTLLQKELERELKLRTWEDFLAK